MAAKTWNGEWWKRGRRRHGVERHHLRCGAQPDLRRYGQRRALQPEVRSPGGGDNLFLASIVALDADTGKYVWHYQINPGDSWDFTATTDMIAGDAHDRRQAPQGADAGAQEWLLLRHRSPYRQTDLGRQIRQGDLGGRIDLATGRPVENTNIRYETGPIHFWPSCFGMHNWQPMAYSPLTNLVYIPTMKLGMTYQATQQDIDEAPGLAIGSRRYWIPIGASVYPTLVDPDDGTGSLIAWDPVQQRARWKVPLPSLWNGGVLVTAGNLVFQGTGSGLLRAYDAATGKMMWQFNAKNGIVAPPITFMHAGTQYLTVLVGYGGAMTGGLKPFDPGWRYGKHIPRVLTFKLRGKAVLPPTPPPDNSVHPVVNEKLALDPAAAERGEHLWNHTCALCHGAAGAGAGPLAPDLRESAAAHDYSALRTILKEGTLASGGMPQFDERTDEEIRDLQHYIERISRAATSAATH